MGKHLFNSVELSTELSLTHLFIQGAMSMKLCWDNIENIRLSNKGNFYDIVKRRTYHLNNCLLCNELFFGKRNGKFCSRSCRSIYNKTGFKHTEETKKKMSNFHKGKTLSDETKRKIGRKGEKHPLWGKKGNKSINWKGGYYTNNIPTYDTYVHQLEWCEKVRRNEQDPNILEVKCTYCGKWFVPTLSNVKNRIKGINSKIKGECNLYCSDECKNSCSIYGKTSKQIERQNAIRAGRLSWLELGREVQSELRQLVLERDSNQCIKCGSTDNLQCHHILPINIEPLLSADVDNCITLCVECHKEIHMKDGCKLNQLHIKEC